MVRLHASSIEKLIDPSLWEKKQVVALRHFASKPGSILVIFVYGIDYPRPRSNFIGTRFWESLNFWISFIAFVVSTIILFFLRCYAGHERMSFSYCLFEMYSTVIGNGRVRIRNGWEKLFFSGVLVAAFLFVSIYLANYSMHSLLLNQFKVDSFEELAKRDVPFYLSGSISEYMEDIRIILR